MTREAPAQFDLFDTFVARGRLAQQEADHLAYHGPGLTFGELAIGDSFRWADPIPRGPKPLIKLNDRVYTTSGGSGEAEAFYRVERWTEEP